MSNLLKRLSMNLERRVTGLGDEAEPGSGFGVTSSTSFNDFSMHISQEVDEHADKPVSHTQHIDVPSGRGNFNTSPPVVVGSAPASFFPGGTKSLTIPRTSVAHILMRDPPGTPRSSLEAPCDSLPTPRASMSSEDMPSSPRSPTSPSGRRRRQQKIHGMDYYEFCELVRAGSL